MYLPIVILVVTGALHWKVNLAVIVSVPRHLTFGGEDKEEDYGLES